MNYYWLRQLTDVPNTLMPNYPSASAIWSGDAPILITGTVHNPKQYIYFLPFYESTVLSKAFLVSSDVGDIWKEFQKIARSRSCAFGHIKTHDVKPYTLIMPRILEGLHSKTVYYADGNIKKICLSKDMVGANQVFTVRGEIQIYLIVSEAVLEEMLRRNQTVFHYEPVECEVG